MIQPSISDYEAEKILKEINRLSYLHEYDDPLIVLNQRQNSRNILVGYLEKHGRHIKRIHASPVVYVFVGSYQDPDRDTTAEHFLGKAGKTSSEDSIPQTAALSIFDQAIARLRCRVPAPKWDWNAEVRRFAAFLHSLSQKQRLDTMQHMLNVLSQEMEEEETEH